ncbi:hypothetical protein ACHAXT_011034 [Thalassiosira profunda]
MGKKNRKKVKEESPTQHGKKRHNKKSGQWETAQPISSDEYARVVTNALTRTEDPLKDWAPPEAEDCPICLLPQPLEFGHSYYFGCCNQLVCWGCKGDALKLQMREKPGRSPEEIMEASDVCPFCRQNYHATPTKERVEREVSRAESGSIEAMHRLGLYHHHGEQGIAVNMSKALSWYKKASDAGHPKACHLLGKFYQEGLKGLVDVNLEEAMIHYQRAAELGHYPAFKNLADAQVDAGAGLEEIVMNTRKAMMCGVVDQDNFVAGNMKNFYKMKIITKEEYLYSLKVHQMSVEKRNSPSREDAICIFRLGEDHPKMCPEQLARLRKMRG